MPDRAPACAAPADVATGIPEPGPGAVSALPPTHGSGDALLLAALASRHAAQGRLLVVVTASALDATRLADEVRWFAPALRVRTLADWETLPYDALSPHQDLVSDRLATLYELQGRRVDLLAIAATTALHRLPPASFVAAHTFTFDKAQTLDEAALRAQLALAGYEHVSQVVRPGEFCVRGGLIDLFPMGSALPYRLDLFDDQVESIRAFDPDTQRSLYPVDTVRILPGREFPMDEASRTAFRGRWRERFEGDPSKAGPYRDVGNGIASAGIEYWLPLFFEGTATLFDYLPADALIATHGDVEGAGRRFTDETAQRHKFLAHDSQRPLLRPDELFLGVEPWFVAARAFGRYALREPRSALSIADDAPVPAATDDDAPAARRAPHSGSLPPLGVERRADAPLARLSAWLDSTDDRVLIVAESAGRRETLAQLLGEHGIAMPQVDDWASFAATPLPRALGVGPLAEGFRRSGLPGVAVVTESELFAGAAKRRRGRRQEATTDVDAIIRDLSELSVGDPVVHAQHGIGRYRGLVNLDLGDGPTEFLHLQYANDATLYVPVSQLHLIGRYSGASPDEAPLHGLGSGQWERAKQKAAKRARDTAAELLNIYARRAARQGHAFRFDARDYEAFAAGFGFDETPDQLAAIHAVTQDLVSGKPMDRLICGDVGFGKTEVALRAAFVAAADGKQVVILCPTTLLAEQHHETFKDRFSNWPFRLAELSRFRSPKEVRAALDGLADGSIDIVIGTHKLLGKEVRFRRLGLVIIDEEHRFGVRQKERLKALRAEVDVLTLTATPIPRTLALSLEGLREFSVIATAPQKRLAIKTFVSRFSEGLVREAVLRELKRGGQVYFLHNEVETIGNWEAKLAALVPEARIRVAHGQMGERDLEAAMRDFYAGRFNVLLCTTIIETGIDVPSANTMLINRADRFGLAQLHQLRGRVGRSHHQAYAYLLTPDEDALGAQARKRLEAITLMDELGAGFYLAMHDLEIRGAGEVLGETPSGEMQQVGVSLYLDLLNRAVKSLKAGREPDLEGPLHAGVEIRLHTPALLPADWCTDVHERLVLYKRLAGCETIDNLDALAEELVDRFGRPVESVKALLDTHRLRILAEPLGVAKIDAAPEALTLQFRPNPPIDPARILQLIQTRKGWRLSGPERLRIDSALSEPGMRVARLKQVLADLAAPATDGTSPPAARSAA
ncbi:MAG: transcription-repair coupling factor [Burkholderiales bacterium]